MKRKTNRLKWGLAGILLAGLFGWGALFLFGVKGIYVNHVIATFEITGIESQLEADQLGRWFQEYSGTRHTTLSRRSLANQVWMARVQFAASDAETGRNQIQTWLNSVEPPSALRLVKATYYEYRIYRPGRGDIVLGLPQPIGLKTP